MNTRTADRELASPGQGLSLGRVVRHCLRLVWLGANRLTEAMGTVEPIALY